MTKENRTRRIKAEAYRLGFMFCGVSEAEYLEEEAPRLEQWLKEGRNGKMEWMERNFDKRLDPRLLVDDARSVVSVLLNYYPSETQEDPDAPKISKYAYGKDYHFVIKDKLKALMRFIEEEIGEVNGRFFVDSAPVMDKAWAQKSGLGWVGKNTNLINKDAGSFFFIGELILDLDLVPDGPVPDYCGNCTRCLDACPTGALDQPYQIDASKCISYVTIELKDHMLPTEMEGKMENWAFGCDICQDVCPWNKFAQPHQEPAFDPHPDLLSMSRRDWEEITEDVYRELFRKSAVKRAKFEGLKRNIKFLSRDRDKGESSLDGSNQ